jgi:hypothetical protein
MNLIDTHSSRITKTFEFVQMAFDKMSNVTIVLAPDFLETETPLPWPIL